MNQSSKSDNESAVIQNWLFPSLPNNLILAMKNNHYIIFISMIFIVVIVGLFSPSNAFAIEYTKYDDKFYNVGIEIENHYKLFSDIDKTEFPDKTTYSRWYEGWANWVQMDVHHDIGQKIDLENFDEVTQFFENYQRKWCADSVVDEIFFDVPVDTGYISCMEIKNFDFKQVTIDERLAYHVSYQWHEKFRFAYPNGDVKKGQVEFEQWVVTANLIPYGDDLIVVSAETIMQNNSPYNKRIFSHSINSFKILNDGKPIFHETMEPVLKDPLPIEPSPIKPLPSILKIPALFPLTPATKPPSEFISLEIDHSQGLLQRDFLTYIKIFGEVRDYLSGVRIELNITDPEGTTTVQKLIGTKDGYFENYLWFDEMAITGLYTLKAQFREEISQTSSFEIIWPTQSSSGAPSSNQMAGLTSGISSMSTKEFTIGKITYEFLDDCKSPNINESNDAFVSWDILQKTNFFRVSLDEGEIKKVVLDCNNESIIFIISSPKYDSMTIKIKTPDHEKSAGFAKVLSATANGKNLIPVVSSVAGFEGEFIVVLSLPSETNIVEINNFKILPNDETESTPNTPPTTPKIPTKKVPDWIKNNAKWWADSTIDDYSFKQGISFMIKENIIVIDDLPAAPGASESAIPDWIKNNAKWCWNWN